ncbi:MAG: radical SAM protein, partial [Candidatus Omnitrophota bacterium]
MYIFNKKILKNIFICLAALLIQTFILLDVVWCGENYTFSTSPKIQSTALSPAINIYAQSFHEIIGKYIDSSFGDNYSNEQRPPFLKALEFSDEDFAEAAKTKGLLEFRMHVIRECTLNCIYCLSNAPHIKSIKNIQFKKGDLSLEKRKSLVANAKKLGAKTVVITGSGDPLLYPDLDELIAYINMLGLRPVIFTSAILLTKKRAKYFYDNNVSLIVKLNSFIPKMQDHLVGVKGSSTHLRKRIEMLIKLGFTENRRLCINSIISKDNYDEIPALFKFCRENKIIPWIERISIL